MWFKYFVVVLFSCKTDVPFYLRSPLLLKPSYKAHIFVCTKPRDNYCGDLRSSRTLYR